MRKILYIMCGPAGCGKSCFVSGEILHSNKCCRHVSRDAIRFRLITKDGEYFSREKEVFDKFCNDIQDALYSDCYEIVYADATHLTVKSRMKLLDRLDLSNVDIIPIYFDVPMKEILYRNAQRVGRKLVPEKTIQQMDRIYHFPSLEEERYEYKALRRIDKNGYEFYITKYDMIFKDRSRYYQ